jgi:membrane-associated protease RseP (regulator of RpoE activity)
MDGDAEAGPAGPQVTVTLVLRLPHRLQPPGQPQRVTVIAAGEIRSHPVAGFQVTSVHSIFVAVLMTHPGVAEQGGTAPSATTTAGLWC